MNAMNLIFFMFFFLFKKRDSHRTIGVSGGAVATGEGAVTGNNVTEREIEFWLSSGLKKNKLTKTKSTQTYKK